MKLTVNNTLTEFPGDKASIQDLLKAMNFTFPMIIIKVNGQLVKKEQYATTLVTEGDRVDAIHLISGG